MAQQRKGQRARQAKPIAQGRAKGAPRARAGEQALSDLRVECDKLRAQLEETRAEVAVLRARQADVLNRIDWVLDSLNSLPFIEAEAAD